MANAEIVVEKTVVLHRLSEHATEGERLLERLPHDRSADSFEADCKRWRNTAVKLLERYFSDPSVARSFLMETGDVGSSHLPSANQDGRFRFLSHGIQFLKGLGADLEQGLHDPMDEDVIQRPTAVLIIRRILQNFHKHLEAMYREKVHGSGTFQQKDLDRIRIGNEYDVQRMLYSLIRPIFPEARMEVTEDTGYRAVRYDIFLDEYDLVIEVKCSRSKMRERDLLEELGADAFHYPSSHLFLFVYDKEKVIANVDVFRKAYLRDKSSFGKDVEAVVLQPIDL